MTVYKVGADIGNDSCKFKTDANKFLIATSVAEYTPDSLLLESELTVEKALENIMENLDFTVKSPALKESRRYIVGKKITLDNLKPIELELKSDKSENEILNYLTLIGLAVDALKRQKTVNPKKIIKANIDLGLALPIKQINVETALKLAKKYIGTHELVWHVADQEIEVHITVEFARCLAEGAAAMWGIVYDKDFNLRKYKINRDGEEVEISLENELLLGADIGGGTTEFAVTLGVGLKPKLSDGQRVGTKESIDKRIKAWNAMNPNKEIDSTMEFNEIFINSSHPRHNKLIQSKLVDTAQREVANNFFKHFDNMLRTIKDDVISFIFGGGQLFVKRELQLLLEKKDYENVIFHEDPVFANAEGLFVYICSPRFQEQKAKYLDEIGVSA